MHIGPGVCLHQRLRNFRREQGGLEGGNCGESGCVEGGMQGGDCLLERCVIMMDGVIVYVLAEAVCKLLSKGG